MFILMTAMALILSIYFGVGKLLGMSTTEVLTQGLGQFAFRLPAFLAWIVGLTVAIRRLKRNRFPAALIIIALGLSIIGIFALHVTQMALLPRRQSRSRPDRSSSRRAFSMQSVVPCPG